MNEPSGFEFSGKVVSGRLVPASRAFHDFVLQHFDGKEVDVHITHKKKPTRSAQQNKYYWVLMGLIAKEIGVNKNDAHILMGRTFLGTDIEVQWKGQGKGLKSNVRTVKTTTALTENEFSEYIDKIKQWAEDFLCLQLPNPEDIS